MSEKPAVPAVKDKAKSVAKNIEFDASFFAGCLLGAVLMHYGPGLIAKVKPASQPKQS